MPLLSCCNSCIIPRALQLPHCSLHATAPMLFVTRWPSRTAIAVVFLTLQHLSHNRSSCVTFFNACCFFCVVVVVVPLAVLFCFAWLIWCYPCHVQVEVGASTLTQALEVSYIANFFFKKNHSWNLFFVVFALFFLLCHFIFFVVVVILFFFHFVLFLFVA